MENYNYEEEKSAILKRAEKADKVEQFIEGIGVHDLYEVLFISADIAARKIAKEKHQPALRATAAFYAEMAEKVYFHRYEKENPNG